MMDCRHVRVLLSEYADNALSSHDMSLVQAHIQHCESCQSLLEEFRTVATNVRGLVLAHRAPDGMEEAVLERLEAVRSVTQSFRMEWLAVYSALIMAMVVVGGGIASLRSFGWSIIRLVIRILHAANVSLFTMLAGQSVLIAGILLVSLVIFSLSFFGLGFLMRKPVDSTL